MARKRWDDDRPNAVALAARETARRITERATGFDSDEPYFKKELQELQRLIARRDPRFVHPSQIEKKELIDEVRRLLPTAARPMFDRIVAMDVREAEANRVALYETVVAMRQLVTARLEAEARDDSR